MNIMKRFFLALLIAIPVMAHGACDTPARTHIYSSSPGTGTSLTVTGVTIATGENVILQVFFQAGTGPVGTITSAVDSDGVNSYGSLGVYVDVNGFARQILYVKNATALSSGTITVTLSQSSSVNVLTAETWTGLSPTGSASSMVGNYQASPGTGIDGVTTGNITPPVADSMIWGIGYDFNHGTGHMAAGTGFTGLGLIGVPALDAITEYKVVSSTTPVPATFTTDINDSRESAGAAFPLNCTGGTVVNPLSGKGGAAARPLIGFILPREAANDEQFHIPLRASR